MQNSGSSSHGFTHKLFKFQYKRVLVSPTGRNLLCSSLFLNAKLSSNEEMRTIIIFCDVFANACWPCYISMSYMPNCSWSWREVSYVICFSSFMLVKEILCTETTPLNIYWELHN